MGVRKQSLSDLAADWLRQGIRDHRWGRYIPGVPTLAKECGVAEKTIRQAILTLEREGFLSFGGLGRRREIVSTSGKTGQTRHLRIGVLLRERMENEDEMFRCHMSRIQAELEARGHACHILPKSQADLKYKDASLKRIVEQTEVDAWLVIGGARDFLIWLAARSQPVFGMGGACTNIPNLACSGSYTLPAHQEVVRRFVELGHRRIVFFLPKFARIEGTASMAKHLEEALALHGISTGRFNFPDWTETPEGLQEQLDAMFRVSPPTAIFATQPIWIIGILSYLAKKGLKVPDDVSLACGNEASFLQWHTPEIARYTHDDGRFVRRFLQWVENVARQQKDCKYFVFPVRLTEGQSLGPVRGSSV